MMTEYVTLEQAAVAFATQSVFSTSDCLDALHYAIQKGWITPSDVAPVRHGRWENGNPICPVCGGDKFKNLDADIWCDWQPAFCPNCGAKMDGGAD